MKKRFSYIFALSLALSALTACGGEEEDKPNPPSTELDAGMDVQPDSGDIVAPDAGPDVTPDAGEEVTTDGGEEEVDAGPQGPIPVDELTDVQLLEEVYSSINGINLVDVACEDLIRRSQYTESLASFLETLQTNNSESPLLSFNVKAMKESLEAGYIDIDRPVYRCLVSAWRPILSDFLAAEMGEQKCSAYLEIIENDALSKMTSSDETCGAATLFETSFVVPKLAAGDGCKYHFECISHQCTPFNPSSCGGVCAALGEMGAPCNSSSECAGDLRCDGKSYTCTDEPLLPAGEACQNNVECADGLLCIMKKCSTLHEEGTGCSKTSDCAQGLKCSESNTCIQPLAENAECTSWKDGCGDGLVCQKTATLPSDTYTCLKVLKLGEDCSLGGLKTKNLRCGEGAQCSPEDNVCIPRGSQTEGKTCYVDYGDGTNTTFGCAPGYSCNETTDKCDRLADVGETCKFDVGCFDFDVSILTVGTGVPSPFRGKGDDSLQNAITNVRCVASTTDDQKVCSPLQDVGGACMAKFSSPMSGCKADLLCMPNEEGADEKGYTGTCQKAPGVGEKCATHTAYSGKLLCDPASTNVKITGEECTCVAKGKELESCQDMMDCAEGLVCSSTNLCLSMDKYLTDEMACVLINGGGR